LNLRQPRKSLKLGITFSYNLIYYNKFDMFEFSVL